MRPKTITVTVLAALTILIALTSIKIITTARNEYLLAEEFFEKNEIPKAVNHYERAVQWFLPFSKTPNQAAEKLWEIAQNQQIQNQNAEALKTCRILRGAFYSVRSFYTPGEKWIHLCNDKIAHIMAMNFFKSREKQEITLAEKKSQYLLLLEAERPPFLFASLMTEIGFLGWVFSAILFIFKALTPEGHFKKRLAILFVSTFLLFYCLWIWGMFNT
tara:strand:+ start:365 stop:1015 length:651 start_codon:yes stop_codon:yes gene_type:complete